MSLYRISQFATLPLTNQGEPVSQLIDGGVLSAIDFAGMNAATSFYKYAAIRLIGTVAPRLPTQNAGTLNVDEGPRVRFRAPLAGWLPFLGYRGPVSLVMVPGLFPGFDVSPYPAGLAARRLAYTNIIGTVVNVRDAGDGNTAFVDIDVTTAVPVPGQTIMQVETQPNIPVNEGSLLLDDGAGNLTQGGVAIPPGVGHPVLPIVALMPLPATPLVTRYSLLCSVTATPFVTVGPGFGTPSLGAALTVNALGEVVPAAGPAPRMGTCLFECSEGSTTQVRLWGEALL